MVNSLTTYNDLNEALGVYRSHVRTENGVFFHAENGIVEVTVYRPSIIRVTVFQGTNRPDGFSYAVCQKPAKTPFNFSEEKDTCTLKTDSLELVIEKTPLRLRFLDADHNPISSDCPCYGASWLGNTTTVYKQLQDKERFIGLGEKTGPLDKRGCAYTNTNTDRYAYSTNADPLYASFPFYIGIYNGLVYGIFLDSTYKTTFNFGASNDRFSFFSTIGREISYFFFHAKSIREILSDYTWLTGRPFLPPLWSLGYQQCRYSYFSDREMLRIGKTFREKDIPADVLYLDIHYMDDFKVFTWNRNRFPHPKKMIRELAKEGFHVVAIFDPGIKIEKGYECYEDGKRKDVFLKYPDGEEYSGKVWPGWCHFPDYTDPRTRSWWSRFLKDFVETGIEGFWNDMNEPAIRGQSMPEMIEFDYDGRKTTLKKGRNVYGMQMARATSEGVKNWMGEKRPFVLTRSAFSGIQRYSAIWTGDNVESDEHMIAGIRLVNNLGLAGVSFAGYDIGGYVGDPSPALFARWISHGVFSPLCRGHSGINTKSAEPWTFGEEAEKIARNYIKFRYRLLPYLYSLFYESARTGLPVSRSMVIDHPHDPEIYKDPFQNQFYFGPWILVAPVTSGERISRVYLPQGKWYHYLTEKAEWGKSQIYVDTPVDKIPVFFRAGGIVPMVEPRSTTTESMKGTLQVHIYSADDDFPYVFEYYEDDGVTDRHLDGRFFKRQIRYEKNRLVLEKATGSYQTKFDKLKVCFHGFHFEKQKAVYIDGNKTVFEKEPFRLFYPVYLFTDDFDPYGEVVIDTISLEHSGQYSQIVWDR